jgi:ABC-type antimicrobial peptide transport system permease subunit
VAVVGLLLSAVVGARERRAAYSVLRAMGAPAAHLRRWLLLETVPLISLSVGAGLLAGLALCRVTMAGLTLTATGDPTVPPPVMVVPWIGVGALVAIAVTTGVALPLLTARLLGRTSAADDLRIGDKP